MGELSADDIKRIARHFILSSPAGEVEEVLTDVRTLVADDNLLNECAVDIFHTYNIEQLVAVPVPDSDKKLVLSKYGEVDTLHFKDPRNGKIVTVDHMKQIVTEVEDDPDQEAPDVKRKRELLQAAIDKYVADYYEEGNSTVYLSADNANEFIICISTARFKPNNYWSGRWRSVYKVTFQSDKKAKLSGTMKVNVHYYEDGNVQLNTSTEHGETVDAASPDAIGDAIAAVLKKAENTFQNKLEEACANLSSTVFKALRRVLPYTRELFNFASGAHKLAGELTKKQ